MHFRLSFTLKRPKALLKMDALQIGFKPAEPFENAQVHAKKSPKALMKMEALEIGFKPVEPFENTQFHFVSCVDK